METLETRDKSEVSYWIEEEIGCELKRDTQILSMQSSVPPRVGEIIHIDNKMDKVWFDVRFGTPSSALFVEGVCGDFEVVSVKRYVKVCYYEGKIENLEVPFHRAVETFEAFLKKV